MTRGSENSLGLNGIFKLLVFRELQVNGIDALFWGKEIADTYITTLKNILEDGIEISLNT